MTLVILDYIILGVAVVSLVLGLIRGFLKPLFSLAGVFVVLYMGGVFAPVLQPLLANLMDASASSIVSMVASMLIVWFLYFLITRLILKLFSKIKLLGGLNHILGGVFGIAIVYLVVAVIVAFMNNPSPMFESLQTNFKPAFDESWVVKNVFATNPIGDEIVRSAFEKLIEMFESAVQPAQ